jgi:hypothetical protein
MNGMMSALIGGSRGAHSALRANGNPIDRTHQNRAKGDLSNGQSSCGGGAGVEWIAAAACQEK